MQPMPPLDDRANDRFHVNGKVHLRLLFTRSDNISEIRGRLINASPGGLCIDPDEPVEVGALADLDIELEGRPLANTLGLIRWCDPDRGLGVEFFYGSEEEQQALYQYFEEWAEENGRVTFLDPNQADAPTV